MQAALREVLAARRSAREALDELAAQNARLVRAALTLHEPCSAPYLE